MVVLQFDCTILPQGGLRTPEQQRALFEASKSKTMDSKHLLGRAVDVAPYPIDWDDRETFNYFGGYVLGIAQKLGIPLRWGGDWQQQMSRREQTFDDLVHFELL
jgi:peptidoglycan L-alanyl-D-glutamate endopeptidase CwlK